MQTPIFGLWKDLLPRIRSQALGNMSGNHPLTDLMIPVEPELIQYFWTSFTSPSGNFVMSSQFENAIKYELEDELNTMKGKYLRKEKNSEVEQ